MTICYAGCSAPSAQLIADESDDIVTTRSGHGDINWGRERANTRLNPDIRTVTNKRVMRELFREHGVPMPKLVDLAEMNERLEAGEKFIGRSEHHRKGRGFWRVDSHMRAARALTGTRRKKPATHFMEFIDAPREYRVHIFCGKSIRISEKDFHSEDKHDYTTVKPNHPIKHVRRAAKQAVKAVGLDFGAVDILADDENCWVLEVNAAPGLGGSMPRVYAEVFKRWENGEW